MAPRNLLKSILVDKNTRTIRKMARLVDRINRHESFVTGLKADQFMQQTERMRERLGNGETLNDLLVEAFALVREAALRTLGQRHFDVQLMGGIILHEGGIAEMRTGEGKTLVATLAAYLNALPGRGVHVITVNDYLAARDAEWMRPVYELLGVTVGVVASDMPPETKKAAYAADITYGTNNEFGFDYLRDNMAFSMQDKVQRGLNFAIIDEVDSILVDEARTPLVISGPTRDSPEVYARIDKLVGGLERHIPPEEELAIKQTYMSDGEIDVQGHYILDEKSRQVELTEKGHIVIEKRLIKAGLLQENDSLYASGNLRLLHHVQAALRAHIVFNRNVDYIVKDQKIVIVDEHTGRTMPGRRWSEGLHQAIEAKERVPIERESQTLASITFQNYFRLYEKLSGMTGTADTESFEFRQIYGLDVVVIPTNKPMVRADLDDLVYMTEAEKYEAIVADIDQCVQQGRPVLVGTISVESSERLSRFLKQTGIGHSVLNAKFFESEAEIIAQAGQPGSVTIATNMAGRGTDIVLGGNWQVEVDTQPELSEEARDSLKAAWQERHEKVLAAGGLHVIGTDRHESRRIDNQLRGRAGRQGDPGTSRFYLSMEDSLVRIFIPERVRLMMQGLGLEKGEAIEHRMLSRAIEKAQRKVEGRNFDIRKNLLEYDDVANDQRQLIYAQRDELMQTGDISEIIRSLRREVANEVTGEYIVPQSLYEQWDVSGLEQRLKMDFNSHQPIRTWLESEDEIHEEVLRERILGQLEDEYEAREQQAGADRMRAVEKALMLMTLDRLWKEHLAQMDYLRQGIHLRAYAQKQPKQEYKRESFELFQRLLFNIRHQVIRDLSVMKIRTDEEQPVLGPVEAMVPQGAVSSPVPGDHKVSGEVSAAPETSTRRKVGRNETCPCGSGLKYKKCCGRTSRSTYQRVSARTASKRRA